MKCNSGTFHWFFPRAFEQRVLWIVGARDTSSHFLTFLFSHPLIFSAFYLQICTCYLIILASTHIIFSSSHPLTFTSVHILTSSHLHISSSHLHILSWHLHIFAFSLLRISSRHLVRGDLFARNEIESAKSAVNNCSFQLSAATPSQKMKFDRKKIRKNPFFFECRRHFFCTQWASIGKKLE